MVNDVYVKTLQRGRDGATWYVGTLDPLDYAKATDRDGNIITPVKGDLLFEVNRDMFMIWDSEEWVDLRAAESEYVHMFVEDPDSGDTDQYRGTIRSIGGAPYYVYEHVRTIAAPAAEDEEQEGE